mmetsp:Transcript_4718/g.7351  ORF Transcript_4718/g.7351 Transcript_4718/m.7351 type:complete len:211 (+) Transcript_4718:154-786(+)
MSSSSRSDSSPSPKSRASSSFCRALASKASPASASSSYPVFAAKSSIDSFGVSTSGFLELFFLLLLLLDDFLVELLVLPVDLAYVSGSPLRATPLSRIIAKTSLKLSWRLPIAARLLPSLDRASSRASPSRVFTARNNSSDNLHSRDDRYAVFCTCRFRKFCSAAMGSPIANVKMVSAVNDLDKVSDETPSRAKTVETAPWAYKAEGYSA